MSETAEQLAARLAALLENAVEQPWIISEDTEERQAARAALRDWQSYAARAAGREQTTTNTAEA